jgi:hypothetical protein
VAEHDRQQCRALVTRRAFLGGTAAAGAGAVLATGLTGGDVLAGLLPAVFAEVRFGQERAFVGDQVALQVRLGIGANEELELRLCGPAGYVETLSLSLAGETGEVIWRVPRAAVPLHPGVHPITLEARRSPWGSWHAAAAPLEVLINRFGFGL